MEAKRFWIPERRWHAGALAAFVLALGSLFHGYVGEDPRGVLPVYPPSWQTSKADQHFTVWLVARNAWALTRRPQRIFDAESCHPASNTLALTEPGLTLGLLAVPAYLASGDPILTYNWLVLAIPLISAFAMYLLVTEWTAVPAAGIVAGLVYAFHVVKVWNVVHLYIDDTAWTVLALWLATRLFEHRRWRDAAGLAAVCALQIGGSLYPLLAATVLAIPVSLWLAGSRGLRQQRILQWALVVGVIGLAALLAFSPFLALERAGVLGEAQLAYFLPWPWLLPQGNLFPGWLLLAAAILGIALPGRFSTGPGRPNPRFALFAGGLLVLLLATGDAAGRLLPELVRGETPPSLFRALARFVPGLDMVRAPLAVYSGVHVVLCVLAGLGTAALILVVPKRYARLAGVLLIAIAWIDTLRPRFLGLEPRIEFEMRALRPDAETLDFYRSLELKGNRGPLFEVPTRHTPQRAGLALLLSAYHHRRTSQCMGSFHPPSYEKVRSLGPAMPAAEPLRELREMGFTTVVLHHDPYDPTLQRSYTRFARRHPDLLRRVHANASMTAYAID